MCSSRVLTTKRALWLAQLSWNHTAEECIWLHSGRAFRARVFCRGSERLRKAGTVDRWTDDEHAMKIAIFWPNWIGDAVMATPAVRAIRSYFIGASWINVLKPYVAGVLEGAPWQERQVVLDSKGPWSHRWPRVAARLRREKIDIAILFPNSFHAAWVAYLAGCGRRIGYRRYGRDMLLTDALPPVRDARGKLLPSPVLDAYNRLAERAGCSVLSRQMELFTTPQDELGADAV